jgi:serine/threonine-protein kinase
MSFVYKAMTVDDRSLVALKFPAQRPDGEAFRQFIIEGRALVSLHHPNIVKVHTVALQDNWPYIVMHYVDGRPLAEAVGNGKSFSASDVYRILSPIASALDYVHANSKVHRDVKPGNILSSSNGGPILVDFGIVQTGEPSRNGTRIPRGTVWYMSPEQAAGKRASPHSDQYSLAIVAYEMLAGRAPFDGDDPRIIIRQHLSAEPPIPANWSEPLKALMRKSLEKNPESRFSSCKEFIDGLRGYMVTNA